ncbi:MAG TPA: sulfotransferase [Mycobacteriales bacterium]|nr:sulfotransferase [Mycobacteriales bacterium]
MTAAAGRLPTFFLVGAQKSGTSTLHRVLQLHPDAFLCDPKEPHYFSDPAQAAKGEEWYRSLFAEAGDARAVGEASTTYAMYPHYSGVVDRVVDAVPAARLIYLVREPLARMRSAYLHGLAWGSETRPIGQALREDPRYLQTSCYALQLEQWLRRVPRERVLLLSLDELQDQPGDVLARTAGFLDIDATWRPGAAVPPANVSVGKRAPRAWWRYLGAATVRSGRTSWVPDWVVRLNDSDSPAVRREIEADELEIPAVVAAELTRALSEDRRRLARLWGPEPSPEWLHPES